jgi:hypothetical protein
MTSSNPDTAAASGAFIYGSTLSLAFFVFLIVFALFRNFSNINIFWGIVWLIFPAILYLIGVGMSSIGSWISCKRVNVGRAFLSSLFLYATTYISLGIASIPWMRLPIASVFAPLFDQNISCNASLALVEAKYPGLKGIGYGYYAFWGVLFGQILNANFSTACGAN